MLECFNDVTPYIDFPELCSSAILSSASGTVNIKLYHKNEMQKLRILLNYYNIGKDKATKMYKYFSLLQSC